MNAVRPHVPEEELTAFHDGELSSAQRAEIAEHLLSCLLCRALEGEVLEIRSRASVLLSRAVPRPSLRPQVASRRRTAAAWRGPIAAGLVAVAGGAAWLSLQPGASQTPRLATAFVAPGLFADVRSIAAPKGVDMTQRSLSIASRSRLQARVVGPTLVAVSHGPLNTEPVDDIDPAGGGDWEGMSLDGAVEASRGPIARLEGLTVSRVQVRRSASGERPTVLVRQQTADGQPVWVVEGPVDELASLSKTFEASGLAMSIPLRTRPDYLVNESSISRSTRVVALAGYLPVDSLDALTVKLKRD